MQKLASALAILVLTALSACGGSGSSAVPTDTLANPETQSSTANSHHLMSFHYLTVDAADPSNIKWEVMPVREAEKHWNVLTFLENGPCTNCFKLLSITPSGSGTLLVQVQITHPFASPNLTGFDVRGIAMFAGTHLFPESQLTTSDRTAGEAEVVNADGYTTLYNWWTSSSAAGQYEKYIKGKFATQTPPNSSLNAYKRFISAGASNTRNCFYAGESLVQTYEVDMPSGVFHFGYAVDASWAPPIHKPVIDPIGDFGPEANCPEPWKIVVSGASIGPVGAGELVIDVYDWQGKDSHKAPRVECTELFNGEIVAVFEANFAGFSRWRATVTNQKSAPDGTYKCLVSVEDNANDPAGKPWLDLTAYQVAEFTISSGFNLQEVTPPHLNGPALDYEISGHYLFSAAGFNGLQIWDVNDPANPVWVNNVLAEGETRIDDVAVSNGYAYLPGYGDFDFIVADVDPVEEAHVAGTIYDVSGIPWAVETSGNLVYLATATYPNGLVIIYDVSNPQSPNLITQVPFTKGFPREIHQLGDYLYLAADTEGVRIIDANPPESATVVKTVTTSGACVGIYASGSYAYATCGIHGLDIIDITDPTSASVIKNVPLPDNAEDVTVSGGYAYVADSYSGVQIVDVDPPGSAAVVHAVNTPFGVETCTHFGKWLVAGGSAGMLTIDISVPTSASIAAVRYFPGYSLDVAGTSDRIVCANWDGGTLMLSASPPEASEVVNALKTGVTTTVDTSGNYAFVPANNKLYVIDLSSPGNETIIKSVAFNAGANDVTVVNGYAYVAAGPAGLVIYDVDPPANAFLVSETPLADSAETLGVRGGYAYVGMWNGSNAFSVVDVDPPNAPAELITIPLSQRPQGWAFSGNYGFVANTSSGLTVLDLTNPAFPAIVGSTDLTGASAQAIDIAGNYAFVLDYSEGVIVVDISDPTNPVEITHLDLPGYLQNIDAAGQYAYVVGLYSGVRIVKLW